MSSKGIIGHKSVATTLDVYTHSTDELRKQAAERIDKGFGRSVQPSDDVAPPTELKPKTSTFEPYKGKKRKPGAGCISQIGENLWEGRYSPRLPNGKRLARNVYANTLDECEEKLKILITEMKIELAELRSKNAPH